MITLLFRALMYLVSAGLGLIAADLLLEGFQIEWDKWWGFVVCIVIFAILQSVLAPWVSRMADRYAPVLMGGIGRVTELPDASVILIVQFCVAVVLPVTSIQMSPASTGPLPGM